MTRIRHQIVLIIGPKTPLKLPYFAGNKLTNYCYLLLFVLILAKGHGQVIDLTDTQY